MNTLENITAEEMKSLSSNSAVYSADKSMVAIKRGFFWEILSRAQFRSEAGKSRCVGVFYDENILGRLFGPNRYDCPNLLIAGDTAGRHYHKLTREIFYNPSLEHPLWITLEDVASEDRQTVIVDGNLVDFEGEKWFRGIMAPENVAHAVHNPNKTSVTLIVFATMKHGDADAYKHPM